MIKVLVSLDDRRTQDVVKTAFRQFADVAAYDVPPHRLFELLGEERYHAVVVDLHRSHEKPGDLLLRIREADASIEVLCLVDREVRQRHNRIKMEARVFSFVPTPIDAFDLVHRIDRLRRRLLETADQSALSRLPDHPPS